MCDVTANMIEIKKQQAEIRKILEGVGCNIVLWSRVIKEMREDRGDTIGCIVDEQGLLKTCVLTWLVDEQTIAIHSSIIKYATKHKYPYAVSITKTNRQELVWLDVQKQTQLSGPPTFNTSLPYVEDEKTITTILNLGVIQLIDDRSKSWYRIIDTFLDILLTRSYLHRQNQLDRWDSLNPVECEELVGEAYSAFGLDENPTFSADSVEDCFDSIVESLRCLPPAHPVYNACVVSLIDQPKKNQAFFSTAPAVHELMLRISELVAEKNTTFADPAMGIGYNFFDIVTALQTRNAVGYEINMSACKIAKIMAVLCGVEEQVQIFCMDAIKETDTYKQYGIVVIDPPIGVKAKAGDYPASKVVGRSKSKQVDLTDLFIEKAINLAVPGGKIIVLVTEGTLFSSTSKTIRDIMLEETIVKAIISLPAQALKPLTGIKSNILVLQKKANGDESARELFLGKLDQVRDEDISGLIDNLATALKDGHI